MANVYLQDSTLTAIGDAIRQKTGKEALILPKDMPTEIASISGGGSATKYLVTCPNSTTGAGEHEGGELVELTYDESGVFTGWNIVKGTNVILAGDGQQTKFVMPQEDVSIEVKPLEPKIWYYKSSSPSYDEKVIGDLGGKNALQIATSTYGDFEGPYPYDTDLTFVYSIPEVSGTWSITTASYYSKRDSGEIYDGDYRAFVRYEVTRSKSATEQKVTFTPNDGSPAVSLDFCIMAF